MAITKNTKDNNAEKESSGHGVKKATATSRSKHAQNSAKESEQNAASPAATSATAKSAAGFMNEIDSLFADKKKKLKQQKVESREAAAKKTAAKKKARQQDRPASTNNNSSSNGHDQWRNDGLGGKYNSEGYTGRTVDGCKVFKTHLLQSDKSGSTPDCPFDCSCCYI